MKSLNNEKLNEIFIDYILSLDEMICVKGGESSEPITRPNPPQVNI